MRIEIGVGIEGVSRISVFHCSRVRSAVSVAKYTGLWPSLPLRSWAQLGSATFVVGCMTVCSYVSSRSWGHPGSAVLVVGFMTVGSSSSLRIQSRQGSAVFVVDFLHLGSPSSLRTHARVGSPLSFVGGSPVEGTGSVVGSVCSGSSFASRSWPC